MLLVIDAGNSHTVIGLYRGDALAAQWRVTTEVRTADEFRALFSSLLSLSDIPNESVNGCCISSVVPALNHPLEAMSQAAFDVTPLFIGPGVKTGLVILVDNPKEVGADRIVNAVGALQSYSPPLIIVDFGTATTFDVISERAEYLGGAICPGIQIAADALFERCAKLPRVELIKPPSVIGKDTVTHIRSGLIYGYADMVDGLIGRMASELERPPTVLATGGYASLVSEVATGIDHIEPFLTLEGLKAIYDRHTKGTG